MQHSREECYTRSRESVQHTLGSLRSIFGVLVYINIIFGVLYINITYLAFDASKENLHNPHTITAMVSIHSDFG